MSSSHFETIRRGHQVVGNLEFTPGRVIARDEKGRMVGYYDEQSRQTRRTNGALFCEGNQVCALIQ